MNLGGVKVDIKKIYTKNLHNDIIAAIENNKKIEITNMNNGFIKHIRTNEEAVIITYNTFLPTASAVKKEGFVKLGYKKTIEDLKTAYEKTQNNSLYRLVR